MPSKRNLETRLDSLEPTGTDGERPRVTVDDALDANTVRIKETLDDAVVLVIDGEEKAMAEAAFKEFWVEGLKREYDKEDA